MKKQKNDNEKQIWVYLFQVVSILILFFCVWLLTREKTYNVVELMPDTVVSESDMVVKERFGLEANAFDALVYYGPNSNMDAAELLLVDLKDTSQKETVTDAIQKRIDYQKTCFEGYGVDQMELLSQAKTIVYGHYVLFIVSKDSQPARDAFAEAVTK